MANFTRTKRLTLEEIQDLPISETQTYYAYDKDVFFKDLNGYRFAITNAFYLDEYWVDHDPSTSKLKGSLIIEKYGYVSQLFENHSSDVFELESDLIEGYQE